MSNPGLKLYDVCWGLGIVRRVRVRAEDAVVAVTRIRDRYGWRRSGSLTVDAKTRGEICCEMLVAGSDGRQHLLVATVREG